MTASAKFFHAARRAVATFVFASSGMLAGKEVFAMQAATWKLVASAGIGALINLAYRWSEAAISEP